MRNSTAEKLKRLLIEHSHLIEEYTAVACPDCTDVCCRQKHCLFREKDIVYLTALGKEVPVRNETLPPDGPCQFMGRAGCSLPRWRRPFRCTWYFCEPLLSALHDAPARRSRELSKALQKMADLYGEL
ncbi:MAG: hypothetical protein A2X56_10020 [Nitrospirae bacterium GWC2_57_13]|jgi:hypothetical protein|nr:MAG: hypothetical protein A2X56_10020 [Nitrospirae bacterium GWC2_57_13]OGW46218.1 MAG: hypothetical protein A2X57_05565 [Nitrospirae bacterium GWD2_57_8]HAR45795.1 hypothetical protein [Nitrospiraceae bacterium]HAS53567.1 hypothetical protein [Nitrospiraceae bacterium]